MGYETKLIFNNIEVPKRHLRALRYSIHKLLLDEVIWSYMLAFLIVEDCNDCIFDLHIPKLQKQNGEARRALSRAALKRLEKDDDLPEDSVDEPWYYLRWNPCDDRGKWYHTDEFVAWIAPFCSNGFLFQLVYENDGGLWGWQFDDGKYRSLVLHADSRWRHPKKE